MAGDCVATQCAQGIGPRGQALASCQERRYCYPFDIATWHHREEVVQRGSSAGVVAGPSHWRLGVGSTLRFELRGATCRQWRRHAAGSREGFKTHLQPTMQLKKRPMFCLADWRGVDPFKCGSLLQGMFPHMAHGSTEHTMYCVSKGSYFEAWSTAD